MNKNISLVINKFKNSGGTERYLLDLINGFNAIEISPNVYATYFDKTIPEYRKIIAHKISLKLIPKILRNFFLSKNIQEKKKSNEIIISLAYTESDIVICGGQHIGYLNSINKKPNLSSRIKIKAEKIALNNAKLIIAHSKLMKDELIKFYNIEENKIEIIYPPVDLSKFNICDSNKRNELRRKFGFQENETIYLFPSTGHKRKGFDLLADYFRNTSLPIKLVVAGTPVKEEKNIISLGFRKDIAELYQAADFTIMASIYEPFGLVGLESIFSGTPIVFSENMACTEVFNGRFGYTFDRNNKESLDNVIKDSYNNKFRIDNPYTLLSYNPSLENHISLLCKEIEKIQNR
ncbi:glycosyltransferase family 4 protein [Mannheimia indoligenes]|uniref:glycosyltransferase family 4 protein n=1 Tax=Mannheimia indoligenes TaxID=3103145 RepID=UPI002FE69D9D